MSSLNAKELIKGYIKEKEALFTELADDIWGFAETRFSLTQSADRMCDVLEKEGFTITRDLAGMKDAYIAEFGTGRPVIGILAEYDALANLSQVCDLAEPSPITAGGNGHGCGHHLLGAGAVAGAVGIKDYLIENNISGTIRLFGCPAEESGYGKAFMARDGVFDGTDAMLTWHPMDTTGPWDYSSLAVYQVYFHFKGRAAHAAAAPEYGRSALDAAELMNVGVNFLREHIIDQGRIHYAFMDAGGISANVVQPTASLYYFVRAPKKDEAKEIYDRVVKVAKGAAMMTDTELEIEFDSATPDDVVNKELTRVMYENLKLAGVPEYTPEEIKYTELFFDTLPDASKVKAQEPLNCRIAPLTFPEKPMSGSTDVGDASWIAPTATVTVAAFPKGTPPHSWQWVAAGKSGVAHKSIITAGETIAMTALDLLNDADIIKRAQKEHAENIGGQPFESMIPAEVYPR